MKKGNRYTNRPVDPQSLIKFKEIIIEQLVHYSNTNIRKYNLLKAAGMANIKAKKTAKKYALQILTDIFRSSIKAQIVYDISFGKVTTSYQGLQNKCENAGAILLTTPREWFKILQNRGKTAPIELSVKIKYKKCHHEMIKIIHNIGRRSCGICSIEKNFKNLHGELTIEYALTLARLRGLKLLSTENDFKRAIASSRLAGKNPSDVLLKWKCKECHHEFFNRYSNIKWHGTDCLLCNTGKEQRITHKICEYIFGDYLLFNKSFTVGKSMVEIFQIDKLPLSLRHSNVHVDIFGILKIGDRRIVLAVEYNGQQHEDSKEGLKSYNWISHGSKYNEWRNQIQRDRDKLMQFKNYNDKDYYLIVVSHKIHRNQRLNYIVNEFEKQSGLKLDKVKSIDWCNLYYL